MVKQHFLNFQMISDFVEFTESSLVCQIVLVMIQLASNCFTTQSSSSFSSSSFSFLKKGKEGKKRQMII